MSNRRRPAPPASPADVAAAIKKPQALLAAEAELEQLRRRRDEIAARQDEANAVRSVFSGPGDRRSPEQRLADRERAEVESEIRRARAGVAAARAVHAGQLQTALAPLREAALTEIGVAAGALLAAWERLDQVDAELRRGGATPSQQGGAGQARLFLRHICRPLPLTEEMLP